MSELNPGERVRDVRVTDDTLDVDLMDGRTIMVPLVWFPSLLEATPEQRANWKPAGGGYGINWPDLDEDLSTAGLLRGPAGAMDAANMNVIDATYVDAANMNVIDATNIDGTNMIDATLREVLQAGLDVQVSAGPGYAANSPLPIVRVGKGGKFLLFKDIFKEEKSKVTEDPTR